MSSTLRASVCLNIACLLLLGGANRLAAQSSELGQIAGTVTDPQGAAVPGAKVTVTNVGTSIAREPQSDGQGSFAVRSLVPGIYKVDVSSPNFQTQSQSNI